MFQEHLILSRVEIGSRWLGSSQEPITGKWPTPDRQPHQPLQRENHHEESSLGVHYFDRCNCLHRAYLAGLKDAKNKDECEKAGGVWVEKDNKCGVKPEKQ
jgi:hypothetical protein